MNFILGSGIIGRIAKDLYPTYNFIPFGKSRFYNYNPPIAENYVVANKKVDYYFKKFRPLDISLSVREYKRPYSLGGNLLYVPNFAAKPYLEKVYGESSELHKILSSETILKIYSDITPQIVYNQLASEQDVLSDLGKYGKLINIDQNNRLLKTTTGTFEYDKIISTIPLNALLKFLGLDNDLEFKSVWIYLIQTKDLDFEGADEVRVVEDYIDFYDVVKLNNNTYMFKSLNEIKDVNKYFSAFITGHFNIMGSTFAGEYIPLGKPDTTNIDDNIKLVGSLARWDDFCDVSTSVNSLIKSISN